MKMLRDQRLYWAILSLLILIFVALVPPGTLPSVPDSNVPSDAFLAHWPNSLYLRTSILDYGRLPLWNPERMLGLPFAANPLSKVWYPPSWIVILIPPTMSLNLLIYLHAGLMAFGGIRLARRLGLGPAALAMLVIGWSLNPKIIAHLGAGHLDIYYAVAWVPWVIEAGICLGQEPNLRKAAVWGGLGSLLVLADIRIGLYVLPAAGLLSLVVTSSEKITVLKTLGFGLLAALLLLGLTAVQWLPLIALSRYMTRSRLTVADTAVFSFEPSTLTGLIFPNPRGGHEAMIYIGLPVVALAVLGLARMDRDREHLRLKIGLLALSGVSGLWSFGPSGLLYPLISSILPLLSWFRVPSRAWFVAAFGLILVAALTLDRLTEVKIGPRLRLALVSVIVAGLVWSGAIAFLVPERIPSLIGFGLGLAGTGMGLLMLDQNIWNRLAGHRLPLQPGSMLTGVLTVSLVLLDRNLIAGRLLNADEPVEIPLIGQMENQCGLSYSPSFMLVSANRAKYGTPTLHGVDPFQFSSGADLIARIAGVHSERYDITSPPLPDDPGEGFDYTTVFAGAIPDYEQMAALGVLYVLARFDIDEPRLKFIDEVEGLLLYRLEGGSQNSLTREFWCRIEPNVVFDGNISGNDCPNMILPQNYAPGWKASLNGKPIRVGQTEEGLIRIDLPRGEHVLRVFYRPAADLVGIGISALSLLVLGGIFWSQRQVSL